MYRAVLADDEAVILKGLSKLIDFNSLDVEIVGMASNGEALLELIEQVRPDIVITDIMMPKKTGLEVIADLNTVRPEFIFISGYSDFSYAREALSLGAVDYLLKPVATDDLIGAINKAVKKIEQKTTLDAFQVEKNSVEDYFADKDNEQRDVESLFDKLMNSGIHTDEKTYTVVSIGIESMRARRMKQEAYQRFNLTKFSIYNKLIQYFEDMGIGIVIKKESDCLYELCAVTSDEAADFPEIYLEPIIDKIKKDHNIELDAGVGMFTDTPAMLRQSYKTAKYAWDLHFFEEDEIIDFNRIDKNFNISFDAFDNCEEDIFKSIVSKSGDVMQKIEDMMNVIEGLHYGNSYAVKNRVMIFTGNIASKMHRYQMLKNDFYEMQDMLQNKVENATSFQMLKTAVMDYYSALLLDASQTGKNKDKQMIEEVKQYLQKHYAEDISIKQLAEIACVSQNYFSAMFKNETGENYKAYLTNIRMEEALKLLQTTDMKTYEIGEQIGYNGVRRFVDTFKQKYGMSPMEYKKKQKK